MTPTTSATNVLIGALIIAALLTGCTRIPSPESLQAAATRPWLGETKMTGTTGDGDVSIALTPERLAGGILTVAIKADTHSVDLSPFDLTQAITLAADGKTYQPASAPKLNGHHASGTLEFKVKKIPEQVIIKIQGIPAQQQRVYQWNNRRQ